MQTRRVWHWWHWLLLLLLLRGMRRFVVLCRFGVGRFQMEDALLLLLESALEAVQTLVEGRLEGRLGCTDGALDQRSDLGWSHDWLTRGRCCVHFGCERETGRLGLLFRLRLRFGIHVLMVCRLHSVSVERHEPGRRPASVTCRRSKHKSLELTRRQRQKV